MEKALFHTMLIPAAVLLLSSCHVWNFGGNIRDRFVTYIGVDVDKPVDGRIYRAGTRKNPRYYMLAPEISFHPCHPVWAFDFKESPSKNLHLRGVKITGKQRWVEVAPRRTYTLHDSKGGIHFLPETGSWRYLQDVQGLPAGAVPCLSNVKNSKGERLHYRYIAKDTKPVIDHSDRFTAKALSAPFSYGIDPLLYGTTNVLGPLTTYICAIPAFCVMGTQRYLTSTPPLAPEVRELLQNATILEVAAATEPAPDGGYSYTTLSYEHTKEDGFEHIGRRDDGKSVHTWASELHAFADKTRPCVLYVGYPQKKEVLQAMAAPLQAQGFHVVGIVYQNNGNYIYHPFGD